MKDIYKKFAEFKTSKDISIIPWQDSVVWIEDINGEEIYFWLEDIDISYVSWTNGIVSIIPSSQSILSNYFQAIIINSKSIFIGHKVKIGN
jgi:hypothetical protein